MFPHFFLLFKKEKERKESSFSPSFFSFLEKEKEEKRKGKRGKRKKGEEERKTISDFALKQNKTNLLRHRSFRKIDFPEKNSEKSGKKSSFGLKIP